MSYTQYFEEKTRTCGEKFICCTDECPQNLKDFIKMVHFNHFFTCVPNDWIYKTIYEALEEMEETHCEVDDICIDADPYTHELMEWLHHSFALEYCNEARESNLPCGNLISQIQAGQSLATDRIYRAAHEFINKNRGC